MIPDDLGRLRSERTSVRQRTPDEHGRDPVSALVGRGRHVGSLVNPKLDGDDAAVLLTRLHHDADVAVGVHALDGRPEDALVEVLVLVVFPLLDAEQTAPRLEADEPRRADLPEADTVLVKRERVRTRKPGLDGEVDPGVDRRVREPATKRGRVRVGADPRLPLDTG